MYGFIDRLYTRFLSTSTYNAMANLHILKITRAHGKFCQSAFNGRFLVTDLNNGDSSASVITPLPAGYHSTTEIHYSQPPLQISTELIVESILMLRPTVSQPVCLGIKHPSGAYDQIFITVIQLWVC
jgi:hypothetical protein